MHQLISLCATLRVEKGLGKVTLPVGHAVATEVKYGDERVDVEGRGGQAAYAIMHHMCRVLDRELGLRWVME